MKAVILAGGEGTRLRPLTCKRPKPLVRICGKPVLFYILDLLSENGCTDAVIAVRYLGNMISELFAAGKYKDINITVSEESTPLGTAGCVKKAAADFPADEDFIVISGDAMCDFDLSAALAAHKGNTAAAEIICKPVDDPREYGLILGENGRITGFSEKPSYPSCRSDLANTGIYVISHELMKLIPDNEPSDFAKDIFPAALKSGIALSYYEESGYWCDIGDLEAYKRCTMEVAAGKTNLEPPEEDNSRKIANRSISRAAYIGKGAQIAETALIGGNSVIAPDVSVGRDAKLNNVIIDSGAHIGDGVTLNDCIIGGGAVICSNAAVYSGAAIGENAVIGESAVISGGVRVWNDIRVENHSYVGSDLKTGMKSRLELSEEGFSGETNTVITPELAGRLGCALSKITDGCIAVSCGGEAASEAIKNAVLSGISGTGRQCFDLGEVPLPVLVYNAGLLNCSVIVYISARNETRVQIYANGMLPLTRAQERLLENALNKGEFTPAVWSGFSRISHFGGAENLYCATLGRLTDFTLPYRISLICQDKRIYDIFSPYLGKIGKGSDMLVINMDEMGTAAEISAHDCRLDHTDLMLIAAAVRMSGGKDAALPFDFPHTAEFVAENYGRQIFRYFSSPMDNSDAKAREIANEELFLHDGMMLTIKVLKYLHDSSITLKEAKSGLPRATNSRSFIRINVPPQRVFGRIHAAPAENEGAVLNGTDSRVFLRSNKHGDGLFVFAESYGSETASELCRETERIIENALRDIGHGDRN